MSEVQHDEARQEFYIGTPEGKALLQYEREGNTLNFHHTFVPPALRGKGLAEQVVTAGFKYAADHHLKVIPTCPYVAKLVMKKPDWKQWIASMIFFLVFLTSTGISISFSEEIPMRIDGTVVRADEANRRLVVDYEIPATGEHKEVEFEVEQGAGFKDFKKLSQLRKGDLVSLDYLDSRPLPKAIYIIRVPPTKTYFTRKEIAETLLKVKAGHETTAKN
ncbi:MAG: N-acetyltransferase [Candidatus Omnitrophica bacterium]|nr:N-acetyltransferase [Candidatus Omnitrophota bacterium]